jgi:regulator of protease activity HflC (stomatin/prohibitin superfamily)
MQQNTINKKSIEQPLKKQRWDDYVLAFFRPIYKYIKFMFWITLFVGLFLLAYLSDRIFINVYPGQAGVLWKRFDNGIEKKVYEGGMHIINPFNIMHVYETRIQERDIEITALSSEGLSVILKASVRFHPDKERLFALHDQLGPDYIKRFVIPEVQSVLRRAVGNLEPEEVYARGGQKINELSTQGLDELDDLDIILDDLLLKEVVLPPVIRKAIELKIQEEERYETFKYIILSETEEAHRKEIEASGIQKFQSIINESLTTNYLRYRGIQATVELAKSDNAKLVIMGNKDGLPLILNTESMGVQQDKAIDKELINLENLDGKLNKKSNRKILDKSR